MTGILNFKDWFKSNKNKIFADYFTFLKFPTISSEHQFSTAMHKCAEWLRDYLQDIGMKAEIWETDGHPVVFGEIQSSDPNMPTLLIYHHYDVQPVDPLDKWKTPPFEPVCKEGKVYARGASDNKGQCMYTLAALKSYLSQEEPGRRNIKILIEGEEEIGSPHLMQLLQQKKERIAADYILIPDVHMPNDRTPAVTLGVRGIMSLEVHVKTSQSDLHSGIYGGIALNPNRALACALCKLWNEDGSIAIPGFYDRISFPDQKERKKFPAEFKKEELSASGIYSYGGEEGYTLLESNWLRPCLEINGLWGGYIGEGIKTIIPAESKAKISCRLVPGQDPIQVTEMLENYLKKRLPEDAEVTFYRHEQKPAYRSKEDSPIVKIVKKAYEEVFSQTCKNVLMGGSIPIAYDLSKISGGELIFIGVALLEDDIHAPNEHFRLDQFEKGLITMGKIFAMLGDAKTG
ncbi:MAG: M20/M25/M40 family metallo-hydrolase [Simkaniaceae bacterium]